MKKDHHKPGNGPLVQIDALYDERFATNRKYRNKPFAEEFCAILVERFAPGSVIDLGCGTADLLAPFQSYGIEILGVDGSRANRKHRCIPSEFFVLQDLRQAYTPPHRYDLCLCLEVAEHIEGAFARQLIETLAACSDTIVFSAAPPGQAGHGHVHLRSARWWCRLFRRLSYEKDTVETRMVKKRLSVAEYKVFSWYTDNLMVFRNKSADHKVPGTVASFIRNCFPLRVLFSQYLWGDRAKRKRAE
jgi:SAM-dependent methyltransferase